MLAFKIWIGPTLVQDYLGNALINQLKILRPRTAKKKKKGIQMFRLPYTPDQESQDYND